MDFMSAMLLWFFCVSIFQFRPGGAYTRLHIDEPNPKKERRAPKSL